MSRTGSWMLDIVFPPRCAGCGCWSKDVFCEACAATLRFIGPPCCHVCGIPYDPLARGANVCADCQDNRYHRSPAFDLLRCVFEFEEPVRSAVHRLKYQGKTAYAAALAAFMCAQLDTPPAQLPAIPRAAIELVVPVPLHPWRRYRRGYNQSTLLAGHVARHLELQPVELLRRVRHTAAQVALSRAGRRDNVRGAFAVDRRRAPHRLGPVLLIDDVATTGATLAECAKVLKQAGAPAVYALALARQL